MFSAFCLVPLAQRLERGSYEPAVAGSIPAWDSTFTAVQGARGIRENADEKPGAPCWYAFLIVLERSSLLPDCS